MIKSFILTKTKIAIGITICIMLGIISLGFQKTTGKWQEVESVCLNCNKYEWNFWNMFPEYFLVKLGISISSVFNIPHDQKIFLQKTIIKDYQIMNDDNRFNDLPKQLGKNFTNYDKKFHYFSYVPPDAQKNKIIVFIHGSAGNFQWYTWKLHQMADKYKIMVVLPTFFNGNWKNMGGTETIKKTIADSISRYKLQNPDITIISLSNGGTGLTRFIQENKIPNVKNIVFVSSAIEKNIVNNPNFAKNIQGKNIFLFHGEQDDRVLIEEIKKIIPYLGENLNYKTFPSDHFLFISEFDNIINDINPYF